MAEHYHLQVRCRAGLGSTQFRVDLSVQAAWTVLFGPSGSGKSSLLRLVAGLWSPAGTSVVLNGDELSHMPAYRRRIGLVAQHAALFPHLDVLANLRFGQKGAKQGAALEAAVLELLNLHEFRKARIHTLSGGEYQRVALARTLLSQPRLLLLDEVFTGMHGGQRDQLLHRLREYCAFVALPVLSVTHDVVEACAAGGEIIRLEEGTVVAQGPAADVLAPEREALRLALQG